MDLVYETPTVSATAGILRISDPLHVMAELRACVHMASKDAALAGIDTSSRALSIPKIVHTSFMRFVSQPPSFERFQQ
jgi:hypothetical protein